MISDLYTCIGKLPNSIAKILWFSFQNRGKSVNLSSQDRNRDLKPIIDKASYSMRRSLNGRSAFISKTFVYYSWIDWTLWCFSILMNRSTFLHHHYILLYRQKVHLNFKWYLSVWVIIHVDICLSSTLCTLVSMVQK